jgi:hypothetical protein
LPLLGFILQVSRNLELSECVKRPKKWVTSCCTGVCWALHWCVPTYLLWQPHLPLFTLMPSSPPWSPCPLPGALISSLEPSLLSFCPSPPSLTSKWELGFSWEAVLYVMVHQPPKSPWLLHSFYPRECRTEGKVFFKIQKLRCHKCIWGLCLLFIFWVVLNTFMHDYSHTRCSFNFLILASLTDTETLSVLKPSTLLDQQELREPKRLLAR